MNVLIKKKKLHSLCSDMSLLEEELQLYKNKYDSLKNNFKCIICMDEYVNFIPNCGHVGLCKECKNNLVDKRRCVICKENIKYIEIFLPYNLEKINNQIGEIIVENTIITDFSGDNFIKEELESYKNTITSLEYENEELIIKNEYLLNELKEIENTKKNLFREKFYILTREIDNLISEIDFLNKNRIQHNNKVKKSNRFCDFKNFNLNNIFR